MYFPGLEKYITTSFSLQVSTTSSSQEAIQVQVSTSSSSSQVTATTSLHLRISPSSSSLLESGFDCMLFRRKEEYPNKESESSKALQRKGVKASFCV
ncbi:hypothetical protein Q3G72_030343 [Acer saccharum]|nr:hypothetical protein Q3G72_030343 [Acer saccharum]